MRLATVIAGVLPVAESMEVLSSRMSAASAYTSSADRSMVCSDSNSIKATEAAG